MFGNLFSLKISLSLFLSQKLPMNIRKNFDFQLAMSIKSGAKTKKIGGRRVKSWPNVATKQLQSRKKKYNKNIETLFAKQIFSLFIWHRLLQFMLQYPTVWFEWKQSKYPSKELLLYEFLHTRSTDV